MPQAQSPTHTPTMSAGLRHPSRSRQHRGVARAVERLRRTLEHPVDRTAAGWGLVLLWVGCTIFAFVAQAVLPAEFYYDGFFIESIAVGLPLVEPDQAFATTGFLYKFLGLTADPVLPSIFGMLVAAALTAAAFRGPTRSVPLAAVVLSAASLLLFTVYFSWYTKETFAAVAVLAALLLMRTNVSRFYVVAPIMLYGLGLRSYWLIIGALYIGFLVVERFRTLRWWRIATWVSLALVGATVGYAVAFDASLQSIREQVNQARGTLETSTLISAEFPSGSLVTDVLNAILVLVELIVPFPLLRTGSPVHAVYALAIAGLWALFALVAAPLRNLPAHDLTDVSGRSDELERSRREALSCTYLLVSLVTVLAIFEPDYGSYLRHLASFIPLMTLLAMATHRHRSLAA